MHIWQTQGEPVTARWLDKIQAEEVQVPEGTDKYDRETLRFLYDKRMALFNFRRDHEWRIIFGVLILLGAVDAALVSKPICLSPGRTLMWQIGIVSLELLRS